MCSQKSYLLEKDVVFLSQQLQSFGVVSFLADIGVVLPVTYHFEVFSLLER